MAVFLRTVRLAVNQLTPRIPVGLRGRGWAEPRSYLRYLVLAAILTGFSAGGRAQDVASITGTVTDKTGAAVSDAVVKLTDTRTGAVYESKTGVYGAYLFAKVAPGPGYVLTISKDSFRTAAISNLYLAVATTRTQDVVLELGSVSQKVEVKSEGSVSLDTTDTTIGNNFDMRAVQSLPNQFRDNPGNLLRLQPTVISANQNDDSSQSGSRDGSVAGARADQDNITIDGIDAADFGIGQAFAIVSPIPVDAIQEFRTEVANPMAENGRGSGAQTIITTKSGSNEWHGSAREYHRNTATEANDFFNNKAGVPRPKLIRNQFGANLGGPVKKDKLFFFFDYDGRRDASDTSVIAQVPLDHVRTNGDLAYVNNNPGCGPTSTIQSNPNCISFASSQMLATLDPCSQAGACPGVTPGFDAGLLALFNSRFPHANDIAAGDGLNSGGFRFNAPNPFVENTYTTRIDYIISEKQKLFVRFNFNNVNGIVPGLPSIQFPGDPITNPQINRDRSWAIGHTWTINSSTVNQFVYGETRGNLSAIVPFHPAGAVFQLNWLLGTPWSAPFARPGGQAAINPVPTFRDDVTLIRGKHNFQFGGVWKPIRTRSENVNDLIFVNTGLGFTNTQLDPTLRPANILQDSQGIANSTWDSYFTAILGTAPQQFNLTNFIKNGSVVPHLGGSRRDYRYYEYEAYAQDTWRLRSDLTLTYGLRYQYDSVPYETNGLEALASGTDLNSIVSTRVQNGLAGVSGPTSAPLLTYVLGGKGNPNAPGFYSGDKLNFSPRLGLAWNPNFHAGLLGSVLGDRKTVLRAGFGIIYDHNALSAVNFAQDQSSFLFQDLQIASVSGATASLYLQQAPRLTDANTPPFSLPAPQFTPPPFTPFTTGSGSNLVVNGAANGQFGNYVIDPHFKTPYALTYSAGLQRELPGNLQLELDYFGRFGRRLITLADAGQFTDFVDPTSKQGEVAAITNLELAQRANVSAANVPTQQFFENQIASATGADCPTINAAFGSPFSTCTQFVYSNFGTNLQQGNLLGVASSLTQAQLLSAGVGFSPQFLSNYYLSNRAWSAYNALIATLRKRLSHNLQLDFNYTFSHSIDNSSQTARNNGNPANNALSALCDVRNLNACRGNSEFDVTHQISTTAIYDLPFGKGQWIGRNSARWLDEAIGGWQISGIVTWRTGFAFPLTSGAQTTAFNTDAFALFNGNRSALNVNAHTDTNNNNVIQLFADPAAAVAAFSPVTGQEIGSRDILRGPHFSNWDFALAKTFPLWSEKYRLQFRTEAYNAFNNVDFSLPSNSNINSPQFGQITTTSNPARVLQFALRFDF